MPIDDWVEGRQENDPAFLHLINGRCLEALKTSNHKLPFAIRNTNIKIFLVSKPGDELESPDATNEKLEWVKAGVLTGAFALT